MTIKEFDYLPSDAMKIREKVFIEEQGFSVEFDDIDNIAVHFVMYDGERAAAVCRVFYDDKKASYVVGRVAVDKEYRSCHLGSQIMRAAEHYIKSKGGSKISLSAQCRVSGFYESLGYKKTGGEYMDEFCPHIMMVKDLKGKGYS